VSKAARAVPLRLHSPETIASRSDSSCLFFSIRVHVLDQWPFPPCFLLVLAEIIVTGARAFSQQRRLNLSLSNMSHDPDDEMKGSMHLSLFSLVFERSEVRVSFSELGICVVAVSRLLRCLELSLARAPCAAASSSTQKVFFSHSLFLREVALHRCRERSFFFFCFRRDRDWTFHNFASTPSSPFSKCSIPREPESIFREDREAGWCSPDPPNRRSLLSLQRSPGRGRSFSFVMLPTSPLD